MPTVSLQVAHAVVASLILAAASAWRPLPAQACSCAGQLTATPADGAQGVPLDISPVLIGFFESASVQWESLAGEAVPFELKESSDRPQYCTGSTAELVPQATLAPNTTYVVRAAYAKSGVQRSGQEEFRFTTGDSKTSETVPPPPSLAITLVRGNLYRSSCTSAVHGCLSVGDQDAEVSVLDARGERIAWFIMRGARPFEHVHPDVACVEVRARDAAGRRSAPIRRCGDELGLRDAKMSDYKNMLQLNCSAGQILDNPANTDVPPGAGADAQVEDAPADAGADAGVLAAHGAGDQADEADGCSASGAKRGSWTSGVLVALAALFTRRRATPCR